jgi:pheromone shutdown protein TraB
MFSASNHKKDKTLIVNESRLRLLGTIHGLKREGERVRAIFNDVMPDCLAVGIPEEDITTLETCKSEEIDFETTEDQAYYFDCLTTFGEVRIPPADLVAAYSLAEEYNLPLKALDISDKQYAQLFTNKVSILGLLRASHKNKKIRKQGFIAENAEAFALKWDEYINTTTQFQAIEQERERHMADRAFELTQQYERVLAVLPYPRFDGILQHLLTLKKHKK